MLDPGNWTLTARYLSGDGLLAFAVVDPPTGFLWGNIQVPGIGISPISGHWDDATGHITLHEGFSAPDVLTAHFFDGYVSQQDPGGEITGLAGTYVDFRFHVSSGEFTQERGGWSASRTA